MMQPGHKQVTGYFPRCLRFCPRHRHREEQNLARGSNAENCLPQLSQVFGIRSVLRRLYLAPLRGPGFLLLVFMCEPQWPFFSPHQHRFRDKKVTRYYPA